MGYRLTQRQVVNHQQVLATKDAIKAAYRVLRKQGFYCRSNFWCCQGCACSAISIRSEERGEDPEKQKYVFYHQQDNENLLEQGNCYMAWGGPTDGEEIKKAFEKAGLRVEWDGTRSSRFKVSLPTLTAAQINKLLKGQT